MALTGGKKLLTFNYFQLLHHILSTCIYYLYISRPPIIVGRMAQFAAMYTAGKTPKEIPFGIGCFVAAMSTGYSISVEQTRIMYTAASSQLLKHAEYGTPNSWIQDIEETKWRGRWIPFRDQLHSVKDGKGQPVRTTSPEDASSGRGTKEPAGIRECDLVLLYAHGGGFEFGDMLQCFVYQQKLMRYMQEKGVKIGIVGIDYSKCRHASYMFMHAYFLSRFLSILFR